MFNLKLEKKSYEMSFKALQVKMQRSKNRQGEGALCPLPPPPPPLFPPGADRIDMGQIIRKLEAEIKP